MRLSHSIDMALKCLVAGELDHVIILSIGQPTFITHS